MLAEFLKAAGDPGFGCDGKQAFDNDFQRTLNMKRMNIEFFIAEPKIF